MAKFQCGSCGKKFDVSKNEICPACGAAVQPSVLIKYQRRQGAAGFLREEREGHDPKCHDDDAWTGSYGDKVYHQREHDHSGTRPRSSGANPTRLSNANPARSPARKSGQVNKTPLYLIFFIIAIIAIIIIVFTIFSVTREIRGVLDGPEWNFFGG